MTDDTTFFAHQPVALDAKRAGELFVESDCGVQLGFLLGMAEAIDRWNSSSSWPTQCRMISEELAKGTDVDLRRRAVAMLETLVGYLKEPQ